MMANAITLAMQVLDSDVQTDKMLLMKLKEFVDSEKCCKAFPKYYNSVSRKKIINLAEKFSKESISLKCLVHEYDGLKFLKIYKPICNSYIQEIQKFTITENSKHIICKYLHEHALLLKEQVDLCPGFQKSDSITKPRIQIYHFSMSQQNNTISIPPKCKNFLHGSTQNQYLSIMGYRDQILKLIKTNQVVIITHDIGIDKLFIPQFILENASTYNEHCRIVYSNNQKYIAVKNCETIAKRREEVVGLTTGYQIPLKSVSSCNKTNLLFTSTTYFIRCLMGVNSKDAFHGITHVILDDVHERDFRIDLLIFEIREVLSFYPNLKILLLCSNPFNTKPFKDYFKSAETINLELVKQKQFDKNVQVYYLNKILKMINYMTSEMQAYIKSDYNNKKIILNDKESQLILNNLLNRYIKDCDVEAFDKFCYLVQIEHIPVDVQHSESLMNMLMGAAKNNKIEDLKILLNFNSNIYLSDNENRTALDWAKYSNSILCMSEIQKIVDSRIADEKFPEQVQLLKAYSYTRKQTFEVDHKLVFELVKSLSQNSKIGSILIIVPGYDDMLKIQYHLENYFKHNQIIIFKIFKLHKNNKIMDIDNILLKVSQSNSIRKIIFSTHIVESFIALTDVLYVIDSGLIKLSNHCTRTEKMQWISKDRAERRKNIGCVLGATEAICFRLYTSQDLSNFPLVITPELMHMPLDNVCLFVKVLSPYTTIKEYFMRTISNPSNGQIEKSIELLKAIGAFEEQESITILGLRLVDIPLPVQLGKVLIYGIFMQCLDPVLTIISILQFNDGFVLPDLNSGEILYLCKDNLAENSNSDHLTFLRIFQKWQDDRQEFVNNSMSEAQYLLEHNLQVVCEIRSEIVGIVRSAQLIHANGLLSMNYINSCANNWAMVKACFVAGMYPNICRIEKDHTRCDGSEIQFKCNSAECIRKIFLYPGSVLRNLAPDSWNKKSTSYQTDWLFYQNSVHREKACRIHNNTLVTAITIAIFAGSLKKSKQDVIKEKQEQDDPKESCIDPKTNSRYRIAIDNWICFQIAEDDAYLIFHLRQKFAHIFLDLLQNCDNHERLQRYRRHYVDKLKILETISKILQIEDIAHNFSQLERIGERPKALPLSSTSELNLLDLSEYNAIALDKNEETATLNDDYQALNENKTSTPTSDVSSSDYSVNSQLKEQSPKPYNYLSTNKNYSVNSWDNVTNYNAFNSNEQKPISESNILNYNQSFQNMSLTTDINEQKNLSTLTMNNFQQGCSSQINQNVFFLNIKQHEIIKYATASTMKFYILPCWNKTDAIEYFVKNKYNCSPIWNGICQQFTQNTKIVHYVFLFNNEYSCFNFSGYVYYSINNCIDGIRLHEIFKVNFTLDNVIATLKMENQYTPEFVNYVGFGEINFDFGYNLLRCMEAFQKMFVNNV